MAKAQFHKNQRVYVKPVGTWATVERVIPHWSKGLEEPIRVFYEVGLGREFTGDELSADHGDNPLTDTEHWRLVRARNKWQRPEECTHHPHPGTYPVIITAQTDWGGWRVPGAEYDLYPEKIEAQARVMANAMHMLTLIGKFVSTLSQYGEKTPPALAALAEEGKELMESAAPSER